MHADHHLGIMRILYEINNIKNNNKNKIFVFGPSALGKWLYSYCNITGENLNYIFKSIVLDRKLITPEKKIKLTTPHDGKEDFMNRLKSSIEPKPSFKGKLFFYQLL